MWHQETASFLLEYYDNREVVNEGVVSCEDMLIVF